MSGRAVASLVLGVCGIACCFLGPISLLLGNSALGRIRASGGALGGEGMARAGRILGIVGTVILVLGVAVASIEIVIGIGTAPRSP